QDRKSVPRWHRAFQGIPYVCGKVFPFPRHTARSPVRSLRSVLRLPGSFVRPVPSPALFQQSLSYCLPGFPPAVSFPVYTSYTPARYVHDFHSGSFLFVQVPQKQDVRPRHVSVQSVPLLSLSPAPSALLPFPFSAFLPVLRKFPVRFQWIPDSPEVPGAGFHSFRFLLKALPFGQGSTFACFVPEKDSSLRYSAGRISSASHL